MVLSQRAPEPESPKLPIVSEGYKTPYRRSKRSGGRSLSQAFDNLLGRSNKKGIRLTKNALIGVGVANVIFFTLLVLFLPSPRRQQALEETNPPPEQLERPKRSYIDSLPPYGRLNHAVYVVDAERVGDKFNAAFAAYDAYIEGSHLDRRATAFAARAAAHPAQAALLDSSYTAPNVARFHTLLERSFEPVLDDDTDGAYTRMWYEVQQLNATGLETSYRTADGKWEWSNSLFSYYDDSPVNELVPAAYDQTPGNSFGRGIYVSGCFWYPPGSLREWHTNEGSVRRDKFGSQWRMYYIRQVPVQGAEAKSTFNQTAMHVIEGPGLTPDYLTSIGGMRLTDYPRGSTTPNVWRLPDSDRQVGFFRLQMSTPYRWHTVLADGTAHRFSLGLGAYSDEEVAALLEFAGVAM